MIRKWLALGISTGVAVGALVAIKLLTKDNKESETEDDEVKFINIEDIESEEEDVAVSVPQPEVKEEVSEETEEVPAVTEVQEEAEEQVVTEEETVEPEEVKEESQPEEKVYSEEVEEIAKLYPYLEKEFIERQFLRNDTFNEQYPEDTLITISHKSAFEDANVLEEFVKIAEVNGYAVDRVNEKEIIISKKMFTEEGAILSDIYNVANQVECLNGEYEGYHIEA